MAIGLWLLAFLRKFNLTNRWTLIAKSKKPKATYAPFSLAPKLFSHLKTS